MLGVLGASFTYQLSSNLQSAISCKFDGCSLCLQLSYVWQHDCPLVSSHQFCKCLNLLTYDDYYTIHMVAIIVYTSMAVLYSVTCRQIYFCREMQRNASQFRQVFITYFTRTCGRIVSSLVQYSGGLQISSSSNVCLIISC